ncbi:MAG: glycerophosphodiester phosphodiesterase [Acidimicrobiia bacterium]|nr:glycerophosphodiester phosphodiesterase [Acidimicrobiia bacterium]MDQ3391519.1 glycerophosphodiester phosphodiesterase [Actinomycetota bacterium]
MISVIAHRGASATRPENTVDAFREARRLGADAVELDARRTSDDQLVVLHDALLPDGRPLFRTPLRELPPSVPRLGEALDACDGMWVNVEIKNSIEDPDFDPGDGIVDLVVTELAARATPERWLISSFRAETLDRCRVLAPDIRTAWLVREADDAVVEHCVRAGHAAAHPWVGTLTADHVRRCHDAGLVVNTWTCNESGRMRELVAAGVDGICTDVPDVLVEVLADGRRR